MFCAPGLVFGVTEGVGSRFHVLRARTCFRRYRWRRVPFLYFALPDMFSAVPKGPVFMICAPRLVFVGTEGFRSRFQVLLSRTLFRRYRGRRVSFSCFTLPNSFSTVSGRRLPFSCLARLDSLSAVPRASVPIFMFCAPGLFFDGIEGVVSSFHVLRSRTRFRRYRGRCVPFSYFARPDPVSGVPRVSGPVFLFCAPGHDFGGTDGVGSRFHVLHVRTHFRLYRWCRLPFSCFAIPDYFSTVPRASGPAFMFCAPEHVFGVTEGVGSGFMFCAPGLVFGGTDGVGSHFHDLRSRTYFRRYRGRRVPFSCFVLPN
jgi:hypothetical protein